MKIVLASSSSGSRGGGELYLLSLGRALAQKGHEVVLWALGHPRMDELANSFSSIGQVIRCRYQPPGGLEKLAIVNDFNFVASAIAALDWKRANADFVHLSAQNLEDSLNLIRAARISGIPNLCTIQVPQRSAELGPRLPRLRDAIARKALRAYQGLLVTILESRRQDLLAFLGPTPRVRLIPNGVPLFDLRKKEAVRSGKRPELGVGLNDILFLGSGRMVAAKRPLLFLELAQRIHTSMPNARFLWIGDGPLASEWDTWVTQRDLGPVIRRIGWQPDVQPFLLCSDVFLHAAEYEGTPLAMLEAMSAAVPVVATPNLFVELPFLNHDRAVEMTDSTDLSAVLGDRKRLAEIAAAGRQLCEQEFSSITMAENYELLYEFTKRRQAP